MAEPSFEEVKSWALCSSGSLCHESTLIRWSGVTLGNSCASKSMKRDQSTVWLWQILAQETPQISYPSVARTEAAF